ncbi:MAG: ribosome assembly cofactor RimP [Bacteroidales bacterium]|nr:ribosome assembly cofactor RimP [Bacteroidales bacterium]MBK9356697.1 ribosome assembly cofactor RimP [Bacteroidales bacterium]
MINAEEIRKTVEEKIEGTDKFVVEVKVRSGNRIVVLLDSDTSLSIDDCIKVTRHIESVYDRETEDYDLMVSSAGIDQPYRLLRQYIKNIGREVEVSLSDKSIFTGKLMAADENGIKVYRKTKVKKVETEETREIPFSEITQTKEVISFK